MLVVAYLMILISNASKTFRSSIEELIAEVKIHYASDNMQDANNVLVKD